MYPLKPANNIGKTGIEFITRNYTEKNDKNQNIDITNGKSLCILRISPVTQLTTWRNKPYLYDKYKEVSLAYEYMSIYTSFSVSLPSYGYRFWQPY